jgi:hypothetical protein
MRCEKLFPGFSLKENIFEVYLSVMIMKHKVLNFLKFDQT